MRVLVLRALTSPGEIMVAGANGPMKYVGLTEFQILRQKSYHKSTANSTYLLRC